MFLDKFISLSLPHDIRLKFVVPVGMWGRKTCLLAAKSAPKVHNTRKYFNLLHLLQFTFNLHVYKVFYFYILIYMEVKLVCSISHASTRYCMRVKPDKVPDSWTCEECMLREQTSSSMQDKVAKASRRMKGRLSETPLNHESIKGSKNFRSPYDGKSRTNDVSSTAHLKLKRHGDPLKDEQVKKSRAIETSFVEREKQKVGRSPVFHDDRKGKGPKLVSDSMSLNSLISEIKYYLF